MPRPRKYEGPGRTITFYCPVSVIDMMDERSKELGITRGEFIVRTMQGRQLPGHSPQATTGNGVGQEVLVHGEGRVASCSHPSTLQLGLVTRCISCGEAVG